MTGDRVVVDIVGLALIGFIVWFFWLVKAKGVRAPLTSGGYQEQMVLVKGGHTPDVIVVELGKPVRLNFVRQESASCSEMVLLPAFGKDRLRARTASGPDCALQVLAAHPGDTRQRGSIMTVRTSITAPKATGRSRPSASTSRAPLWGSDATAGRACPGPAWTRAAPLPRKGALIRSLSPIRDGIVLATFALGHD
jgi:hypothetical protein